jgi:hypothetical protein
MTKRFTTQQFIERARTLHGNKYDYSKVEYVNNSTPVVISCPVHGDFEQRPMDHFNGNGCRKCSIESRNKNDLAKRKAKFIQDSLKIHGNKYDYSKVDYTNNEKLVTIICPVHGEFEQSPGAHTSGKGCKQCGIEKCIESRFERKKIEIFRKFKEVHGSKYDYSKSVYISETTKMEIVCPVHGVFLQSPGAHRAGQGCRKCADEMRANNKTIAAISTLKQRCLEVHSNKYSYPNFEHLQKVDQQIEIICPIHGSFSQYVYNHLAGAGCPKCSNTGPSKPELEIYEFINSFSPNLVELSNRTILDGKEIDIFSKTKNVGFEFDGIYWHSSDCIETDSYYSKRHLEKTRNCERKGIRLYHIFENEWNMKKDIWKSVILNSLNLTPDRIYARQCKVVEVPLEDAMEFMTRTHLQGAIGSQIRLGLEYSGVLVSLMTFGKPRFDKHHEYELLRFSNELFLNVVGGASKLLSHFKRTYGTSIISYANRRWSNGNLYEKLGFSLDHLTAPGYYYTKGGTILHRHSFMKHKLEHMLKEFDPNLSEYQNMYNNGYKRIWDCGQMVYVL